MAHIPSEGKQSQKVTVLIPIYNGEQYIEETVRSVLNQTYSNLEVVCVIDGTKDRSMDILLGLNDSRIRVLEKENRGATYRRNEGMQLAATEYIWFLDQDDRLMPGCIEAAVHEMERTGCAAVAVNGHLIDSNGNRIRRMYRVNKPVLTLSKLAKGNQLFTTSQALIRRSAIMKVNGFNQDAGIADDWDMWIRLLRSGGKLVFLDQYLMGYRLHDSNHSRNFDKMLRSEMHVLEKTLHQIGNPKRNKSFTYLRYSARAGDWKALSNAVRLNVSLMLNPKLYVSAFQLAAARRSMKKNGGIA
jgi:glycosyltransferase involved in cell wall biosynthesis